MVLSINPKDILIYSLEDIDIIEEDEDNCSIDIRIAFTEEGENNILEQLGYDSSDVYSLSAYVTFFINDFSWEIDYNGMVIAVNGEGYYYDVREKDMLAIQELFFSYAGGEQAFCKYLDSLV